MSISESPGRTSAASQYSNSRSSSPGHPKSDSEQDASAHASHCRCLWSNSRTLKSFEDIQTHIFGCVAFRDRINVLADIKDPQGLWQKALELDREQYPYVPWMRSKPPMKDEQRLLFIRYLAVLGIKGERKRIRIIRSDDKNGPKVLFECGRPQPQQMAPLARV